MIASVWGTRWSARVPASDEGGQPAFEALAQSCDRDRALPRQNQGIATGGAEFARRHACRVGAVENSHRVAGTRRDDVAGLILAEPERMRHHRRRLKLGANAGG